MSKQNIDIFMRALLAVRRDRQFFPFAPDSVAGFAFMARVPVRVFERVWCKTSAGTRKQLCKGRRLPLGRLAMSCLKNALLKVF